MSHRPPHARITLTRARNGSSSSVCAAVTSRNVQRRVLAYDEYGSISEPISTSPRSVCET